MRKKLAALIALFFCLSSALLGCGQSSDGGSNGESVNSTQTQLYVYVFSRGYGSEYLYKLKERYEALHADDSYEEGKKGVQIRINVSDDNSATKYVENVKNQKDDVFFAEDSYYRTLAQAGVLLDITEKPLRANSTFIRTIILNSTENITAFPITRANTVLFTTPICSRKKAIILKTAIP